MLRGRRATKLHARRARRARTLRRAGVVCALLALLAPITAGAVPSTPWASWFGLGGWQDWRELATSARPDAAHLPAPTSPSGRSDGSPPATTGPASKTRSTGAATTTGTNAAASSRTSLPGAASPTTVITSAQCTAYVSPAGSDTNAGNSDAPFATISHAQSAAAPGAIVCVRGGVYHERVRLTRSGRAGAPIVVAAYPSEQPIVDGSGVAVNRTDGLFEIAGGTDYVTVQGLVVRNSSGRGLTNGGSHNRVLATTITNTENAGLLTTNMAAAATDNEYTDNDISLTVQSNDCHTASDPCTATGGWESAINHYTAGAYPFGHDVYRGNSVHDNSGEGMTVADGDLVTGNTFHDNFSVNVYLDGTRGATVEKNYVSESERSQPKGGESAYRLLAMGVTLADETGPRSDHNTIRNNVIVNTSIGLRFWEATSGSGLVDDIFDNNTIVNTWKCGICFDGGNHSDTLVRDNLVLPRRGTITSGLLDPGITKAGNLFTQPDTSESVLAPGFDTFSLALDDYRPQQSAESTIDRGVASSARDDILGVRRPQGGAVDIGAFELPE